jgi:L-amino acid N-acyltransferase YncA
MTIIRACRDSDLSEITAIYAWHVQNGTGTFETDPPSIGEMTDRRADVLSKGLPYLVAEAGDRVLGYAYCTWFKPRPAYRFSAEDSVYIAPNFKGQGIGRALLSELAEKAEQAGIRKLIAVIGDSNNLASVGLHRAAGFSHAGTLTSCGWKFGQWLDVVLMEKALGFGNTTPATAPTTAQ